MLVVDKGGRQGSEEVTCATFSGGRAQIHVVFSSERNDESLPQTELRVLVIWCVNNVFPGPCSEHESHIHPRQRLGEICQHGLLLAAGGREGVRGEQEAGQVRRRITDSAKTTKSNKA